MLCRKASFGTQSERGNQFVEWMMTMSATCKQQGRNVIDYVIDAIRAHLRGDTIPYLFPDLVFLSPTRRREISDEYFRRWHSMAKDFWMDSKPPMERGGYVKAAFELQQAVSGSPLSSGIGCPMLGIRFTVKNNMNTEIFIFSTGDSMRAFFFTYGLMVGLDLIYQMFLPMVTNHWTHYILFSVPISFSPGWCI